MHASIHPKGVILMIFCLETSSFTCQKKEKRDNDNKESVKSYKVKKLRDNCTVGPCGIP
jgi:hypothetical protein